MSLFNYTPSFIAKEKNNHIGLFYDSPKEQSNIISNFIKQGLEKNYKCIYITSRDNKKNILSSLDTLGVKTQNFQDKGQLNFNRVKDTYLRGGTFNIQNMINIINTSFFQAKKEGYYGLRGLAEMNWAIEKNIALYKLKRYENTVNEVLKDKEISLLCQYEFKKFPAEFIKNMIFIHPYVLHTQM
ncbi:MAG: MEDS domain-containing protein [Elusimicrobiota bacterium]